MQRIILEEGLSAFKCSESEGVFIPVQSYFRWLSQQPERLKHLPKAQENCLVDAEESEQVKICPESGQLMQRYRVGHGFSFFVERSVSGSIWLDKGEWESLKERQFHDELHLIFTEPWQRKVRDESKLEAERALLQERLGSSLLKSLDAIKSDLADHEYRSLAIACLQR